MKINLFLLGVFIFLLPKTNAEVWMDKADSCLACLNPHDTNNDATDVYYCTGSTDCQYATVATECEGENPRIGTAFDCIDQTISEEATNCQTPIDGLTLTPTYQSVTISLEPSKFCTISLTGARIKLKISYDGDGSLGAVYEPIDEISDTGLKSSPAEFLASDFPGNEIKLRLVNYQIPTDGNVDFTIEVAEEAENNGGNGNGGNGDPVAEWTAARDNRCLSCLNPHGTKPSSAPVYWCTDANTCKVGSSPSCPSISAVKQCLTAGKKEHSACQAINSLSLTKTPKLQNITLPANSFCYITLSGKETTLKVSYSGSVGVYYPATGDWDETTLQDSNSQIGGAAKGRLLQASTQLKAAIVNYDHSSPVVFKVEAANPSIPDDGEDEDDGGLSGGQIAGIVIGCVAFAAILIVGCVLGARKVLERSETRKSKEAKYAPAEMKTV